MYHNVTRADGYIPINTVKQYGWWTNIERRDDGRRGVARGYYRRWSFDGRFAMFNYRSVDVGARK
jgi:hypothetical protein